MAEGCSISKLILDFGTVCVDYYGDDTFRITNTGTQDNLTGTVSSPSPEFLIMTDPDYDLAPGEYKDFPIRFAPTSAGYKECIIETGHGLCEDVQCIGTGDDTPDCDVSPIMLDFGELCVGASLEKTFRITNTGCAILQGTISLASDSDEDFSIVGDDTYYLFPYGGYKDFTIKFEPLSEGSKQATIETGNAVCTDISCTGEGNDTPICLLSSSSIVFGIVEVGSSKELTLRITNTGCGTLSGILNLDSSSDYFSIVGDDAYSLTNNQYKDFTIRFEPDEPGIFTGFLETGSLECGNVDLSASAKDPLTTPFFRYGEGESYEVTVYLRKALVVPYLVDYDIPATITKTADGKLKVYNHPLAGEKKRTWNVIAWMMNEEIEEYRWIDLEAFYCEIIKGALTQFIFRDNSNHTYLVRMIEFGPPRYELKDLIKIQMLLEEDY